MSKTKTKAAAPAAKKQAQKSKTETAKKNIQDILGPCEIHDLSFSKGYQNIKIMNVRTTFTRVVNYTEDSSDANKATKETTLLIPKNKANYDKIMSFFKKVIQHSELIPTSKKADVYSEIAKFKKGILRDGDAYVSATTEEPYPGTAGNLMLKLKSTVYRDDDGEFTPKTPVKLYKASGVEVRRNEASQLFYSGCWVDCELALAAYKDKKGGVGVTGYLQGLMHLMDDENLSGAKSSLSARTDIASDLSDDSNGFESDSEGPEEIAF